MKNIIKILLSSIVLSLLFSSAAWSAEYQSLSPVKLKTMLKNKNFFLMDVHVPEYRPHLPGTDTFIDFRKIRSNADKLPADKNTTIIVYCLGGPMGEVAARTLVEMGYTHVYNLKGGAWAFNQL